MSDPSTAREPPRPLRGCSLGIIHTPCSRPNLTHAPFRRPTCPPRSPQPAVRHCPRPAFARRWVCFTNRGFRVIPRDQRDGLAQVMDGPLTRRREVDTSGPPGPPCFKPDSPCYPTLDAFYGRHAMWPPRDPTTAGMTMNPPVLPVLRPF